MDNQIRSKTITARITPATALRFAKLQRTIGYASKADAIELVLYFLVENVDLEEFVELATESRKYNWGRKFTLKEV